MTLLCKRVWSSCFNSYSKEELTFENMKIYASEQILRNLVRLFENCQLKKNDLKTISHHLQNNILTYMWHKYPMTLSQEVNRALNR